MTTRIDVLGAGVSGLVTAWLLAKRRNDLEIHVWERDASPGGLAGSFATEDFAVEKFYHHLFRRDVALQRLLAELGLEDDLRWRPARTGAYYFQRPYRLSSPLDLLRFEPLPFLDRVRMGLMVLRARMVRDWHELDDISAEAWIRKVSGDRVYEVVWAPLLHGKFGPHAREVSAAWLWSKLVDRGGSRDRSGFETLGYLRGGLGRMFEALVHDLEERGHRVHLGKSVTTLHAADESGTRLAEIEVAGERLATDRVVSGLQVPELTRVLPVEAKAYRDQLAKIDFLSNACLVLVLSRSLSEFYWTNVTDPEAPFVGIVEQTRWADSEDFQDRHLAYISAYVAPDDPRLEMEPDALFEHYLPWIRKILPSFDPECVEDLYLWTADHAQPVVRVGYRHLVPEISTPIENLFVCTMAQIYPNDRQVSNGVEMAGKTADAVLASL